MGRVGLGFRLPSHLWSLARWQGVGSAKARLGMGRACDATSATPLAALAARALLTRGG